MINLRSLFKAKPTQSILALILCLLADRRGLIKADLGIKSGTATLQMPVGTVKSTITDRDIKNDTCQCQ